MSGIFDSFPPAVVIAISILFLAGPPPTEAARQTVWGRLQVDLPSNFYGNYSYNADSRQTEFIFGVASSFDIFGWIERVPKRLNGRPQRELVRHLKSSLRSEGYRMVAKTERKVGGRWRADFTGRSQGGSYRRQVTIVPTQKTFFLVTVSSPSGKWGSSLSRRMRAVPVNILAR
jgi:hypothetical protein